MLGGTALGGIGTVVSTTGLGCSGGFRGGGALSKEERKGGQHHRPLTRDPGDPEVLLPEEPSGDGPMLIWTAPNEGAGTSHSRHPGGEGDSVFTSRTSSPMNAYVGAGLVRGG